MCVGNHHHMKDMEVHLSFTLHGAKSTLDGYACGTMNFLSNFFVCRGNKRKKCMCFTFSSNILWDFSFTNPKIVFVMTDGLGNANRYKVITCEGK